MQAVGLTRHGGIGHFLQARIDGGAHHQPVGIDVVVVAVSPLDQPAPELLGEVRGQAQGFDLPLKINLERHFLERLKLGLRQLVVLDHLHQHDVAPRHSTFRVNHRVVVTGAFEHADQRGAFEHIEFVRRLVEIRARGHFNAIGVVQKRHGVQVSLQNLVLGIDRFDFQRRDGFLELARERGLAANFLGEQIARQLLREGRAALQVALDGMQHGRRGSRQVHAVVLVETVVFGSNQRAHHMGRDVGQLDPFAVGPLEDGQFFAISRQHHRRLGVLDLAQIGNAGREGNQHQRIEQQQDGNGKNTPDDLAPGQVAQPVRQAGSKLLETGQEHFHCRDSRVQLPHTCCRALARPARVNADSA